MEVIYIFWLRQIKRYIRSKPRFIGSLGQPVLFLIALGFGFGPIFEKAGGGNYIDFLTPGIIAQSILFTAAFAGVDLIFEKRFGFLKETLAAPVSRVKIILGRSLGSATIATIQGTIVLFLSLLLGFRPFYFGRMFFSFGFMFILAFLFTLIGTSIAAVLDDVQAFQFVVNFLIMPLFFLSGALFPLASLPKIFKIIATINPLTYGVDALRACLVNVSHFGLLVDVSILVGLSVVFLGASCYSFSKIEV
ncbi:MAG: ABC transporter permease [bacterium]